jgi:serine/threonine protein phosphatase PrpC
MRYSFGVVCTIGVGPQLGGRSRNEDTYILGSGGRLAWREGDSERHELLASDSELVGVFDGMGGHSDGELAAVTTARAMGRLCRPGLPKDPVKALRRHVLQTHDQLHEQVRRHGPVAMGTTLVVAWLIEDGAAWASVGDSRLYLIRRGDLHQLSRDHTRAEFARRDGQVVADGRHLAQNFLFGSRGLGNDRAIRVDDGVDCGWVGLAPADRLVLCTDGVWEVLEPRKIQEVVSRSPDPQAAAVALVEQALARGTTDNATALVVRVNADSGATQRGRLAAWTEEDDGATLGVD